MCFVYGCWYFNAKSVLEVIVFIIGLIVLRRDTLRSSALMGTISIVLAVLLDVVISYITWKSVGWAIFHGLLSWAYVIYFLCVTNFKFNEEVLYMKKSISRNSNVEQDC